MECECSKKHVSPTPVSIRRVENGFEIEGFETRTTSGYSSKKWVATDIKHLCTVIEKLYKEEK